MSSSSGSAYDGYLANCAITFEHPTDATVATNADGSFTITGPSDAIRNAVLVLTPNLDGCGDVATSTSLAITLKAPPMSSALTPLSTLVVYVMQQGNLTEAEADEKIVEALSLPELDNTLHNHDAIASATTSSSYEQSVGAIAMMVVLQKVHNFVLASAVLISGDWVGAATTPEAKEAQFEDHLAAGDLAMTELAYEIVALPAGIELDLSNADLLVDIMKRAHSKSSSAKSSEEIHDEAVAVAGAMQVVNEALDAIAEEFTPTETATDSLSQLDMLAAVFQTDLPEETAALIKGEISSQEYADRTSHASLEEHFKEKCATHGCTKNYPEAVAPSTSSMGVGAIFGIVVAVMVMLSACGACVYYRGKPGHKDKELDIEEKGTYMAPQESQYSADRAPRALGTLPSITRGTSAKEVKKTSPSADTVPKHASDSDEDSDEEQPIKTPMKFTIQPANAAPKASAPKATLPRNPPYSTSLIPPTEETDSPKFFPPKSAILPLGEERSEYFEDFATAASDLED